MPSISKLVDAQKRVDLSDVLSDFALARLKKGMTLGFEKDGVITHYKLVRLNRKQHKCEGVEVKLYKEDEVEIVDASR